MDLLWYRPSGSPRRRDSIRMPRRFAVEMLEARQLLTANFGFVDTSSGFAFQISGTEFDFNPNTLAEPDNIIVGTNPTNFQTNFAIEWVNDSGTWRSLVGGVSAGDIASEARRRGLGFEDFDGFLIKAKGGGDTVHADGSGTFGIRTGAPSSVQALNASISRFALVGYSLIAHGNGGNDRIFGSPGGDILQGGPGDDTISGLAGDDIIFGDMGDDDILAGDNQDQVYGGAGRDEIFGQAGDDLVWGEEDDDVIVGGAGDDVIHGGDGNDDLVGDEPHTSVRGIDKLIGGDGDDSLLGDNIDRNPEGGNGTDAFQAGPSTRATEPGGSAGFQIINSDIEKVDTTGADPGEPTLKDGKRFDRPGPFSGLVELFPDDELKMMAGISQDPFTPGPYGSFQLDDQINSSSADAQVSGENALGLGPLSNPSGVSLDTSINGVIMISGFGDDRFVVSVASGKYRTGQFADRSEGDVNGDGVLDQFDVIAIMQSGLGIARGD